MGKYQKFLIMILALLGAFAILLVAGPWLIHITLSPAGTGGIGAAAGGVSVYLFFVAIVVGVLIVLAAVLVHRRRGKH